MLDEAKKLPVMNADHRPLLLYFLQESNIFIKIHAKFIRNVFSNQQTDGSKKQHNRLGGGNEHSRILNSRLQHRALSVDSDKGLLLYNQTRETTFTT